MGSSLSSCLRPEVKAGGRRNQEAVAQAAPQKAAVAGTQWSKKHPHTTGALSSGSPVHRPVAPELCPAPAPGPHKTHARGPGSQESTRSPDPNIYPSTSGSSKGRGGGSAAAGGALAGSMSSGAIADALLMQRPCSPHTAVHGDKSSGHAHVPWSGTGPAQSVPGAVSHVAADSFHGHRVHGPMRPHELHAHGEPAGVMDEDADEFLSCCSSQHSETHGSLATHTAPQMEHLSTSSNGAIGVHELPVSEHSKDVTDAASRKHSSASDGGAGITLGILQDAAALYSKQPCRACHAVLKYCRATGTTPAQLAAQLEGKVDPWGLQRVLHATASIEHVYAEATGEEGWEVISSQKLFRQSFKICKKTLTFRGQAIVDAPVEQLIAICREFDLVKETWGSLITESVIVHEYSPAELLCAVVLKPSWPVPRLSVVFDAMGAEVLAEHGAYLFACQSPQPGTLKRFQLPAACKHCQHIPMLPGTCVMFKPLLPIEPGGQPRTHATMVICTTLPHVPFMHAVTSFVLKVLGPYIYHAVVRVLQGSFAGPNTLHVRRMEQRSDLYNLIRARTKRHLEALAAAGNGQADSLMNGS